MRNSKWTLWKVDENHFQNLVRRIRLTINSEEPSRVNGRVYPIYVSVTSFLPKPAFLIYQVGIQILLPLSMKIHLLPNHAMAVARLFVQIFSLHSFGWPALKVLVELGPVTIPAIEPVFPSLEQLTAWGGSTASISVSWMLLCEIHWQQKAPQCWRREREKTSW